MGGKRGPPVSPSMPFQWSVCKVMMSSRRGRARGAAQRHPPGALLLLLAALDVVAHLDRLDVVTHLDRLDVEAHLDRLGGRRLVLRVDPRALLVIRLVHRPPS